MKRQRLPRRLGAVLFIALACLALAAALVGVLTQAALARYRDVRLEELRLQAEWLAHAGIERAVRQLRHHPAYAGETWRIDTADGLPGPAEIVIRAKPAADRPRHHLVEVKAEYPRGLTARAVAARSARIRMPAGPAAPKP